MLAYDAPGHKTRIPYYSSPVFNKMFSALHLHQTAPTKKERKKDKLIILFVDNSIHRPKR